RPRLPPRPPRTEISPDGALGSLEEQKTVAPLQRSSGERAAVAPIGALAFPGLPRPSLAFLGLPWPSLAFSGFSLHSLWPFSGLSLPFSAVPCSARAPSWSASARPG